MRYCRQCINKPSFDYMLVPKSGKPEKMPSARKSFLDGWRILVTRPESQAGELVSALQACGAETALLPMMQIKPVTDQADADNATAKLIKSQVLDLDQYQHVIFISTNAVNYGVAWIERYWPQLPVGICWYAIGAATAAALHSHGIQTEMHTQIMAGSMNSEALLSLPALQQLSGSKALIFRGCGGRETLAQTLRERGAQADYCEVYQRQPAIHPRGILKSFIANRGDRLLMSSVTSGETLENLLDTARKDKVYEQLLELPLLLPGKRVAQLAREHGFKRVLVAENAGVEAFLKELDRFNQIS